MKATYKVTYLEEGTERFAGQMSTRLVETVNADESTVRGLFRANGFSVISIEELSA